MENLNDIKVIYIRNETLPNEHRAPLCPSDIFVLSKIGFKVYVQSSTNRIFSDNIYKEYGAIVTDIPWYSHHFYDIKSQMIVIGLKDLLFLDQLNFHTHIYFSHSFKGQKGSLPILEHFRNSKSILYDLEYITENNKRLISFSYFAGISGSLLGILHYYNHLQRPLKHFVNVFKFLSENPIVSYNNIPKIKIIGNGNCTKGVQSILDFLNIPYKILTRKDTKTQIPLDSDIIFNCIKLDSDSKDIFFDNESIVESISNQHKTIIVDVSCDIGKTNNPIPICVEETTWDHPIVTYGNIDIIAISNLPSLLPKESSEHFSEKLLNLLLDPKHIGWENSLNAYYKAIGIEK